MTRFFTYYIISPFLSIIFSVQMVGHLLVEDGAVISHIKQRDLIADVLVFGLRRKDYLREGPHLVIGLCQGQQRYVDNRSAFSYHHIMQHQTKTTAVRPASSMNMTAERCKFMMNEQCT